MGLWRLGVRAIPSLREPSLGPVFGVKGGATGGGQAMIHPMAEINLHCTGDLHAITAANNLLAAVIDNHIQSGNALGIEPRSVTWKRCLDMNDRGLRKIISGLGGKSEGVPSETGFEITAASEIMATVCLAESLADLKVRLARTVIGVDGENNPVTAGQLGVAGALTALLRDAFRPNLVQTTEGTPVVLHGGPFANIAHGCSSVQATKLALALGDICLTEAGFAADLGAEKFLDIKMRQSGLKPDAAVLVATIRALKWHGGVEKKEDLPTENVSAVEKGFANLLRHAENLKKFGLPVIIGINRFLADSDAEIQKLTQLCESHRLPIALNDGWADGGKGAKALAKLLLQTLESEKSNFASLYDDKMPLKSKIEMIAKEIYRAEGVSFTSDALKRLRYLTRRGFGELPICVAKTQYSFSDDPDARNAPSGHTITIRDVKLSAGAGFVVAYAGTLLTMPGLPAIPSAVHVDCDDEGNITGLF
jgi:formate--tetrahydrofolate ligase